MRETMATWLRVLGVLAMMCCVFAAEEETRAVEEPVAVVLHKHFPRAARLDAGVVPEVNRIGRGVAVEHVGGDGEDSKPGFDRFNAFQRLEARREARGYEAFEKLAEMGSWWGNVFEQGRQRQHNHHRYQRHDAEHHHGYDHETLFGRLRASFGWGLPRKNGSRFSAIPSFLSDVPSMIKTWSARRGRKPPTVKSVTEPLDIRALHKISSPSTVCNLREKLSHIFAVTAEVVLATTGCFEKDVINRNLRMFTGDKMEYGIASSVCLSITSPCEQEFCDVFLSHPRSGILMAFRILGLNPMRVAINPEGVDGRGVTSKSQSKSLLSKIELQMITNLKKTRRLSNIVFQRVRAANPTDESASDSTHWMTSLFSKFSGGELNSCEVCLRQDIFRLKKLAEETMIEVCGNPLDSHLGRACNFVKENRFVFWTMFEYNFRLWERAASVCRNQKSCDSLLSSSAGASVLETNTMVKGEDQNLRQRALHRTAMPKGQGLPFEWKSVDGQSVHSGIRPSLLVRFLTRPRMVSNHDLNSRSLRIFLHGTTNMEGSRVQTSEHGITRSPKSKLFRGGLKRPLIDSSPIRIDTVIEDSMVKRHSVPDVTFSATEGSKHPDTW